MANITVTTTLPTLKDFVRGGTYTLNIPVTNSDGTAFNLTGSEVFFTVNSNSEPTVDGTDSTAQIATSTNSFSVPSSGIATITLSPTQTNTLSEGKYFYDVKLKDSSGNMSVVKRGTLFAIDNLTTRTS